MNFQFYVEKLRDSERFKKFMKENKDAFLCSCFFLIDKEEGKDKQHLDFYIPSSGKMFSFPLENESDATPIDLGENKGFSPLSEENDFNFKDVEKMIQEKMEEEKMNNTIQKMLFSMQNVDGKDVLIGTIFISSLGLLNVTIDLTKKEVKDFKKRTFFDMMDIFKKDK